jgi:hypothetical protein
MTLPHIPETPEVLAKDRGIDEALEAIAKGDDSALEHLFHTNAEVHALICVGRKWALRDYPLRAAPIEWKTTDAFRNDRFLYIPESEKRQKEPEMGVSVDALKSVIREIRDYVADEFDRTNRDFLDIYDRNILAIIDKAGEL